MQFMKKSQAAMEYLMTYGWALLIIAVVLIAFYQLGVFGGATTGGPKAIAGSCQVVRTLTGASLQGECQGELPQYVTQFPSSAGSYITVPSAPAIQIAPSTPLTFAFWAYDNNAGQQTIALIKSNEYGICIGGATTRLTDQHAHNAAFAVSVPNNQWTFFTFTLSNPGLGGSNTVTLYMNGTSQGSINIGNWAPTAGDTNSLYIAGNGIAVCGVTTGFTGDMANLQMYNTSLSASEVQKLYLEGIGGAPVRPQNLTAWWPLNGNGNDYSGFYNSGTTNGVSYPASWVVSTGYVVP
jgi:hypothetical protein